MLEWLQQLWQSQLSNECFCPCRLLESSTQWYHVVCSELTFPTSKVGKALTYCSPSPPLASWTPQSSPAPPPRPSPSGSLLPPLPRREPSGAAPAPREGGELHPLPPRWGRTLCAAQAVCVCVRINTTNAATPTFLLNVVGIYSSSTDLIWQPDLR